MENLVLLGEQRQSLNVASSDPHYDLVQQSATIADLCQVFSDNLDVGLEEDPEQSSPSCYCVLTNNGVVVKLSSNGTVVWTTSLREESEIAEDWFQIHFIDNEEQLVCLSKRGAIVAIDPNSGETSLIGVFDQGLDDAVWSPDGETLAMVTSTEEEEEDGESSENPAAEPRINSRLMTMNAQFEVLAEVTIPRHVPSSSSSSSGDSDVSLAWRPDGMLLGVSSVDEEDGVRKIRIYKRETLELHAIGRAEDASGALVKNLQPSRIAWASTGCSQLLAGVQRKGKKTHQVVFFEPNGLRHREFLLREAPTTNTACLEWNSTSDLLAVGLREEGGSDKIQLWHRCNYHWYLKREIQYPNQRVERIKFNDEDPYQLTILLYGLEWREYEVRWDPSTVMSFEEKCNALVVDGSSLNVTEFHRALIPPPMFAKTNALDFPINEMAMCYDSPYIGSLLIAMSNGDLAFLLFDSSSATFKLINIHWEDLGGIDPVYLRSLVVIRAEADRLHFVATACAPCHKSLETLVEVTVEDLQSNAPKTFVKQTCLLEGRVYRMTRWMDAVGGCLIQLRDKSLFEYETSDSESCVYPSEAQPLMEVCPWIAAIKDGSPYSSSTQEESHGSRLVFGLSSKARLYFHDVMLSDSASSFMISLNHGFLCYVTKGSRCQARFLPLKEVNELDPLMGMDQNHVLEGYEPRNVELGARVVAVLPQMPTMILQMPRGNLEGIYPRALVLRHVMTKILDGHYEEAFRMMRKHKVDLNLIVDLDPAGFLDQGISLLVKQVDNIDHLNLFISNLQNYDVKQTRFPVPAWFQRGISASQQDATTFEYSTKVNQVCKKARAVMMDMESAGQKPNRYFLLPILSTFAKEDPPKLDDALVLIKENALTAHPPTSSKNPLFSENAQHSIHYLAFLAEYELLFETSLGMYDFEIARAVARNSQMDPKVYLPLLKRYNALPTYYARYEVDMRLKRFELALRNLHRSLVEGEGEALKRFGAESNNGATVGNSFDNCLSFINEHKLHRVGLELFRNDSEKTRILLIALGGSLMSESRPKTALSVYLSAVPPDLEGAKRAARASKNWRQYFSMIEEEEKDSDTASDILLEQRRQAARDIANEIASSTSFSEGASKKAYSDAAKILIDYGDDLIGALDYLIQAECWIEGYRVATMHSRPDLKKKCVDGAVAFAHSSIANFVDRASEFEKANQRYAEVLKLRKQNVQLEGPEPAPEEEETGSLFSSASTASNMSLRSNASTSSTGSGVSSVISVRTANTFQMTGGEENDRHRSKFHKGKKQKQRDKKKKKKQRKKPGSEEELQELVGVIKASSPNAEYATSISETIRFLIFAQHLPLAKEVYNGYTQMCNAMGTSRSERMAAHALEKEKAVLLTRTEGEQHELSHLLLELPVEKEVDAVICVPLDTDVADLFGFVQAAN